MNCTTRVIGFVLLPMLCLVPRSVQARQNTQAAPVPPASSLDSVATATYALAVRADHAPVIDGRLDDAIWSSAAVIDQFLEYEPNEGAASRFATEARVAYDNRFLYIHVSMFDPAPDSIVSLLARRDVRVNSEQLKLVIDSYHDRRTAYQFAVNPAGVKRDFYVYNDSNEDPSWDAVWDVATVIDETGWHAEFRIPFSQLRFPNRPEHTFGLLIVRDVARTGARISWPLYRRNQQGYVSQAGELRGIRGVPSPRRIELAPYLVSSNATEPSGDGYRRQQRFTGGADVKYGLSSNLTLDATVNPDFGQVEADPAVLNLSAFETFFSERRPFFLEGTGIFDYRVNCGDIDSGCTGLFYSRRIGRGPQLGGLYDDPSNPTATTILAAGKLTGRLASGLSVGLLNAVTQRETGLDDRTIEPATNYAVARVQQDLNGGRSGIGAMVTAVNRNLDEWTEPYLRREAYAAGVDLRHRFWDDRYELAASATGSYVAGSQDAIARLQRDGVHRYQRPDDGVAFDPTRTSLSGDAQRVSFSKFGGGVTQFQTVLQRFSPGFEINDVGFLSRADELMFRNWFSLNFTQPTAHWRRARFNFNYGHHWTSEGLPTNLWLNHNLHIELPNRWWVHAGGTWNDMVTAYSDREARGGPAVRRSPNFNTFFGLEGDNRWRVTPSLWFGGRRGDEGRTDSWWVEPFVRFRAASRFNASIGAEYVRTFNDRQWVGNLEDDDGGTHYTFARLRQTTLGLTGRLNYTITPELSLQFYGQPFISTGSYTDWRELAEPRARRYADRYQPFDGPGIAGIEEPAGFAFRQFRSNAVLRWEYRPGSTLFFVWQQGRDSFDLEPGRFNARRDLGDLFGLHPANTFLIKASYWFNY